MKKLASEIDAPFILGFGLLSFIFLVVSITSVAFLLRGAVSILWLVLALSTSGAVMYRLLRRYAVAKPWLWVLIFLGLIGISVAFSSLTLDTSYDGNAYHKLAIGELKNGWNPIWQTATDFNNSPSNPLPPDVRANTDMGSLVLWVDHYPKATWIFGATLYRLTSNIEAGKALAPLSIIIVFLFAFSLFRKRLDRNKALLIGLLLACNPVIVEQMYSYYNDGILGNFIILLLVVLTALVINKKPNMLQYAVLFMVIALLIDIKFTGLAYAGLTVLCYYVYLLLRKEWRVVRALTIVGASSLIFGVLVLGASSYVKNTYTNGNPMYPLAGKNSVDIITNQAPTTYIGMSNLHKFLAANLGPVANLGASASAAPAIKFPFTISMNELTTLQGGVDVRQAGYGVWFGGVLIVSASATVYLLIRYGRRYRRWLPLFLLPLIPIGVAALAINGSWWARYLPQLCIFPVIVIVALLVKKASILPYILCFMLCFNVILTGALEFGAQKQARQAFHDNLRTYVQPCRSTMPVRLYAAVKDQVGAIYDLTDSCPHLFFVTTKEFEAVPMADRIQLYRGIYVVRPPRG